MSFSDTLSALSQRLATSPSIPTIFWGSVREKRVRGTSFVRPTFSPTSSSAFHFDNGAQENIGIYTVSCFSKVGEGEGPLLAIVDGIVEHFKESVTLTQGSTEVYITNVGIGEVAVIEDGVWLQCNVIITYKNIQEYI